MSFNKVSEAQAWYIIKCLLVHVNNYYFGSER